MLALLLAISILPSVSAVEHNPSYDTWSGWDYATVWSNQSGTITEIYNTSTNGTVLPLSPGTELNYSSMSMWMNSSSNQRVDAYLEVTDNGASVYTWTELNRGYSSPGPKHFVFTSGASNITTVHGHTYELIWHYRTHTIFWNGFLTGSSPLTSNSNAFFTEISEPIPAGDTITVLFSRAYWFPGGHMPPTQASFSTSYGSVLVAAGDEISSIYIRTIVGCNENVVLESSVTFYDGGINVSYVNSTDYITPGYNTVDIGDINVLGFGYDAVAGHAYYFLVQYRLYDGNSSVVAQGQVTISFSEAPVPAAYVGWVDGILWAFILFGPGIVLNRYLPLGRYGLFLGLAVSAILIMIFAPGMMLMSFITLFGVGVMIFTYQRG
jgi:hypothetical protein